MERPQSRLREHKENGQYVIIGREQIGNEKAL
jgi:hypothetical protein